MANHPSVGISYCCSNEAISAKDAVAEAGVDATVEKVADVMEIAKYGVFGTPAVVVDGEIKSVGKIPPVEEVKKWLQK